jgi:hypothetical protein
MWIAQQPDGTWCAYEKKPLEKMGGWDGEPVAYLLRSLWIMNWRQTLQEMTLKQYSDKFRGKEVQMRGEVYE